MAGKTLDIRDLQPDQDKLATNIANQYTEWEMLRGDWASQKKELRNYIFATDTRTTSNRSLPWKNSTTVPKLTQIRDNLHANYMEALFPNDDWLVWEGDRDSDEMEQKRLAIENYIKTKFRQDRAEITISQLVLDFIDYGNCFATVEWASDSSTDVTGSVIRGYTGPRIVRISPHDIVFNPVAENFINAPKILRNVVTLGELAKVGKKMPADSDEAKMYRYAIERTSNLRRKVRELSQGDVLKSEGFQMDGFGSIQQYYGSDYVEVLTFHGDMYDVEKDELYENHVITVIDRSYLLSKKPNQNWTTHPGIFQFRLETTTRQPLCYGSFG
jgi:hypothetical protein